jgi:hypothetical protein
MKFENVIKPIYVFLDPTYDKEHKIYDEFLKLYYYKTYSNYKVIDDWYQGETEYICEAEIRYYENENTQTNVESYKNIGKIFGSLETILNDNPIDENLKAKISNKLKELENLIK